jgi:hypothetical protein
VACQHAERDRCPAGVRASTAIDAAQAVDAVDFQRTTRLIGPLEDPYQATSAGPSGPQARSCQVLPGRPRTPAEEAVDDKPSCR